MGQASVLCAVSDAGAGAGLRGVALAAGFWLAVLVPAHFLSLCSTSYRVSDVPTRGEWLSRVNSNIHAVLVTLGFAFAMFPPAATWPTSVEWEPARCLFRVLLRAGMGYFIADAVLVMCLFRTISSPVGTLVHHAASLGGIMYVVRKDLPLTYVWCGGMFLTEASTPFVNQRWFMAIRHRHEKKYLAAGLLMTVSFLVARPIGMPLFIAWMFSRRGLFANLTPELHREILIAGTVFSGFLFVLNVYWSWLMLRGAYSVLSSAAASSLARYQSNGAPARQRPEVGDADSKED